MNLNLLVNFNTELSQTREYIKHIELINELNIIRPNELGYEKLIKLLEHQKSFYQDKRAFEYKAIIISLYGILEKHIEIFVKEYLTSLSKIITNYNDLNDIIINNHFTFSLDLLKKIEWPKFDHLEKNATLDKLNNCIKSPENYDLNLDSFVISSNGNLKHLKICELFLGVNVKLDSLLKKSQGFPIYL
jgi:hypothetical protein